MKGQLPVYIHNMAIMTVSVLEFTATSIWISCQQFVLPHVDRELSCDLFVSGGGARNTTLMRHGWLAIECSIY